MYARSVVVFLVFSCLCAAQTSRGAVAGTVLDPFGASVADAILELTAAGTNIRESARSNESGSYRFDSLDPGLYTLTLTRTGFKTFAAHQIAVEANRTTTLDPRLEIGDASSVVDVNAESSDLLTRDVSLRGGNFHAGQAKDLPLIGLNPLSLARTLPGATETFGSTVWSGGYASNGAPASTANANGAGFSINGQRPRGNNYLLDGTENNEIWISGEEQVFTITDAVEEVSVQTAEFSVEFGRAGGGVFNVITKSGNNQHHGTLLWRYQSQLFNSLSNLSKLNGLPRSVLSSHIYGFTAGGPIRKNRTFFFAAFQQGNTHSTANDPLQVPTAAAVSQLISLYPGNPRLALYLNSLGNYRGVANLFSVSLGPASSGTQRSVQFGTADYALPAINDGPQWLGRVDHVASERQRLSLRLAYDSRQILPDSLTFPGFKQEDQFQHLNVLLSHSYVLSPTFNNELRMAYERPHVNLDQTSPEASAAAFTLPQIQIANVSAPGLPSANASFHRGNVFLLQETETKLFRGHTFRYGLELSEQLISQQRGANDLGVISFTNAGQYSAFANFLDDFSGPSASATRVFGAPVFYPDQFHQAYFFQDNWKVRPGLALTLGLRYENFGQYANSLPYPAFSGFDPRQFLVRHTVRPDDRDFGPAFGFAWSPQNGSGKSVWRGGFQINRDALPTQLIALGPATTTPNAITNTVTAPNVGRGSAGWWEQLPQTANAPSLMDTQNPLAGNLRNPYTERWSFGWQRLLPGGMFLDLSYVGSESHELTTRADWNPRLPTGTLRLYPQYGVVVAKTSEGNSSYHALQAQFSRRLRNGLQFSAAYTWSKMMDSTSDGVGNVNTQDPANGNLTSVPVMYGGLKLDRALSDYDRPQRLTFAYTWSLPSPRTNWWRYALGGWQLGGIATLQSGTPFSIANGFDRANFADKEDRADIGNPRMPIGTRAVVFPSCNTGYQNPDTFACVTRNQVHWIEGVGFPNASTVGRNTMRTPGANNFDLNLNKVFPLAETRRLEIRWEALNAFNHPQYVNVPGANLVNTLPGRFLNLHYTDGGIRTMWVHAKFIF